MGEPRGVRAVVDDVADGMLTAHAALLEIGTDLTRMRDAFILLCNRYHRAVQTSVQLEDENLGLRRGRPTAIYARRCFWLAVLCAVCSVATLVVVWMHC